MTIVSSSEREPLLEAGTKVTSPYYATNDAETESKHSQGPLEISRANRYAIMAGIFTASFLGVSLAVRRLCRHLCAEPVHLMPLIVFEQCVCHLIHLSQF